MIHEVTKLTKYRLFNFVIFQKEEIGTETEQEGQVYQLTVKQDYYNTEFDVNNKDKKE